MEIKAFDELSSRELYEILKLRIEVFIVEQKGCYQDLDDIDYRSIHVFHRKKDGEIDGCIRVFLKEDEPGTVQLGRLVVRERKKGIGTALVETAAQVAREHFHAEELYLTGRESAYGFYRKCGFYAAAPMITDQYGSYYILRRFEKERKEL